MIVATPWFLRFGLLGALRYRQGVSANGPTWGDPWSLRASDGDREKYLAVLREAYAEGRLTGPEYEERLEAVFEAKTYRDLAPLLAGLPVKPGSVPGPPGAANGPGRAASGPHPPPGRATPYSQSGAAGHYPTQQPAPGSAGPYPGSRPPSPPAPPAGQDGQPSGTAIVPVPQAADPNQAPVPLQPHDDSTVTSVFSSAKREGRWLVPPSMQVFALFGEVELDLTSAILSSTRTEISANAVLGSIKVIVPDSVIVQVAGTGILGQFDSKDKRKSADRGRIPAQSAPVVRVTGVGFLGEVDVVTVKPKPTSVPLSIVATSWPAPTGHQIPSGPAAVSPGDPGEPPREAELPSPPREPELSPPPQRPAVGPGADEARQPTLDTGDEADAAGVSGAGPEGDKSDESETGSRE